MHCHPFLCPIQSLVPCNRYDTSNIISLVFAIRHFCFMFIVNQLFELLFSTAVSYLEDLTKSQSGIQKCKQKYNNNIGMKMLFVRILASGSIILASQ